MTKRIIIMILGLAFAGGIYSDVGQTGAANTCGEFFVRAAENAGKNTTRKLIRKAETLYSKAFESYRGGNKAKAAEYYSQALQTLSMVDMDVVMGEGLEDNYKEIFSKLGRVLTGIDTEARQGQQPTEFAQNSQAEKRYTIAMTTDNRLVKHFLSIYSADGSKDRLETALKRMGKYREMVLRILHEYDLPDELVYLPVIESLYYNDDLSSAGALGIWQIMPERARAMGLKVNYWIDERKDPEKATRGAAQYLKDLYVMFDDWHLALSAYNRGEYGLGRDLKFARATNMEQAGRAVPKETELFVPQFIATTLICDNPKKYGLKYEFDKVEKCDEVVINEVVDLKIAADCAGTSLAKIHELNPAILAWCTPNNYPNFVLKIPAGTRDRFIEKIAMVKDLNPTSGFVKYRVEKGDCLDKIAKKYFTTVAELKQQNNITGGRLIKLNQQLVIRPGRAYFVKVN